MKKITALLLCFFLLCMCSVTVLGVETKSETANTVISVTVPDTHKITVIADGVEVFYEGLSGDEFVVERLSKPRLLIRAASGKVISSVTLNGTDVTELLYGGYLELDPVYEDQVIAATATAIGSTDHKDTYTVKGKVTLTGQPLSNINLELRSELKITSTDKNGNFVFNDVEPGKHSLTALMEDKVVGYLSFELKKDSKTDVSLLEDGVYTVHIDQNGAGVELHLELNDENGILTPTAISTIQIVDSNLPQTGDDSNLLVWWILLVLSAACIVVIEAYRRKNIK